MTDQQERQPTNNETQTQQRQEWQEWDEDISEVVRTVGKLVRVWRERAGLTQAELGARIGYGAEQVSSVERARRIPKPEFLTSADEALDACGTLAALVEDVARARYPRKVRDLARLEADAVEMGAYADTVIHGLLQTEDYARALFQMHRPTLSEDTVERSVAARMARQEILHRHPAPFLSFVLEEVTLRRPIGGKMVLRGQLERLLEIGKLRHVEIQVMPMERTSHAALGGSILLLESECGDMITYVEVQHFSRVVTERKDVRVLHSRLGSLRAQALPPPESLEYIEQLQGET
ncbi:DNA-binding protein [Wenjunlia vitaminophila]|uniref:DNA-binding protein n=1 Tax=Wenjunlia vitaminophila TaxID=76728 RepID=A0A0T6LRI5_WENVI|nr:helix-turn-helix transcriptional regulator [Wenjunlia vitaminophila]KRV48662.1 DNA-binding protein [Wenjunlia vitaminophila]